MDTMLLIGRLILAAVFLVAAIGKLADMSGSRRAVALFGVPESLAGRHCSTPSPGRDCRGDRSPPCCSGTVGRARSPHLAHRLPGRHQFQPGAGRTPDCHCFGQIYSEPVGAGTLIRNAALALLAIFVIVAGRTVHGLDPFAWLTDFSTAEQLGVALGALVIALLAVQSWFLLRLTRQNDRLLRALNGTAASESLLNALSSKMKSQDRSACRSAHPPPGSHCLIYAA